ncbi:unnamed protein product [Orchesella dallaii]|uniref:Uracil-DNA glycosylase-like domain-containing protein n=1 Tax=Orchesella dallaii TaxID=48710 RepID=A0ABP1QFI4_9HEXA
MVHSFFETIASEPSLANQCAERASHNNRPTRSFTQVFSIFFPEDGELDSDVETWLQVIAEGFEFDKKNEKRFTIWEVEKLFRSLGFHPKDPENLCAYNFWLYLIWMYKQLLEANYERDDNVFRFMEGCSIHDVKLVIIGNDPCENNLSSGYAFHDLVCPSTKQLLDFADNEIDLVCEHLDDYRMSLNSGELREAKEQCSLWGWIEQGVLLLNSKLTFEGDEDIQEGWEIFTDFLLKYLSDLKEKVVFLFLGMANFKKADLIYRDKNLDESYHPAHYTYTPARSTNSNRDWDEVLPFINLNLYLWQVHGFNREHVIDWSSMGWVKNRTSRRVDYWIKFLSDLTNNWRLLSRGDRRVYGDFLVGRNRSNGLLAVNIAEDEDN